MLPLGSPGVGALAHTHAATLPCATCFEEAGIRAYEVTQPSGKWNGVRPIGPGAEGWR